MTPPRFSLVLCSVDRTEEPARFLDSLVRQQRADLQLIVVDQNEDDRLTAVLAACGHSLDVVHLRSARGLSRARNRGLAAVRGELVAFPDDDCEYPPGLLAAVDASFRARDELDGLSVRIVDAAGHDTAGRWAPRPGWLSRRGVWLRHASPGLFLHASLVRAIGAFDLELGAGAGTRWGAAEESDYLLRALRLDARVWYEPALTARHLEADPPDRVKHRRYAQGMGRVLRRHSGPWQSAYWIARPLGGAAIALARGRGGLARAHLEVAGGRLAGWSGRGLR